MLERPFTQLEFDGRHHLAIVVMTRGGAGPDEERERFIAEVAARLYRAALE